MNWLAQHHFQFLYLHYDHLQFPFKKQRTDPCSMLGYVVKGRARFTMDGTDHLVEPGMVMAVPQAARYCLVTLEPFEFFWMRYKLWLSTGKPADSRLSLPPVFRPDDFAACIRDLKTIEQLNKAGDAGCIGIEAMAHKLVLHHLASERLQDMPPSRMDPRIWRLRSLLLYGGYFPGRYRGAKLAQRVGLSHAQMHRLFRHFFHDSPKSFWEKERLKVIMCELRVSPSSMADIAEAYGFVDISHFSKWFKHLTGIPPSRYRRLHPAASR